MMEWEVYSEAGGFVNEEWAEDAEKP